MGLVSHVVTLSTALMRPDIERRWNTLIRLLSDAIRPQHITLGRPSYHKINLHAIAIFTISSLFCSNSRADRDLSWHARAGDAHFNQFGPSVILDADEAHEIFAKGSYMCIRKWPY